jgi:hypothetical protein
VLNFAALDRVSLELFNLDSKNRANVQHVIRERLLAILSYTMNGDDLTLAAKFPILVSPDGTQLLEDPSLLPFYEECISKAISNCENLFTGDTERTLAYVCGLLKRLPSIASSPTVVNKILIMKSITGSLHHLVMCLELCWTQPDSILKQKELLRKIQEIIIASINSTSTKVPLASVMDSCSRVVTKGLASTEV